MLADQPLVILLGEQRTEEPHHRTPIRENADDRTPPFEFFVV
jgi:hypothetical protein